MQATAVLLDTETTGLENPEIVEVGYIHLNELTCETEGYAVAQLFSPATQMTWGALAVHHILPSDYAGLPNFVTSGFRLPEGLQYLVGHNIDFDWKALGCPPIKRICTLALARAVWSKLDSHTNGALYYYLNRDNLEAAREDLRRAHSAVADILITAKILDAVVAKLKPHSIHHLWELSERARVPSIMTFGKHKGKPVSQVDAGYKKWYSGQPDPDPYLLKAFAGHPSLEVKQDD